MSEKKLKLSYSQLKSYDTCPKKYRYSYILGMPPRMSHNLTFGTTMHGVLSDFYSVVQQDQANGTLFQNTSEEFLLSLLDQKWISRGYISVEHMEDKYQQAQQILHQFYQSNQPDFGKPLFLEKKFVWDLGDFTVEGRFDRVDDLGEGKVEIIDYKSGKSKDPKELKKDFQLSIYAMAIQKELGLKPAHLYFYFLADNQKVEIEKSEKDLAKDEANIRDIAEAIQAQEFAATPDPYKCKFCDFRDICEDRV